MMKKLLSFMLILIICLGLSSGAHAQAAADPIPISTAEDLISFASRVNNGEYDLDAVLTADISLDSYNWTASIGAFDQHSIFDQHSLDQLGYTGTFDGAGHQIDVNISDYSIFGKIGTGGIVKNLTVNGTMHSRAVLAYCCAGTISNCHTSGSLFPTEDSTLPLIGSIVAELGCLTRSNGFAPGTIVGCTSDVDIRFEPSMVNYGYYNIGGIVGTIHEGTVDRCFFNGHIELQGAVPGCNATVGGIVGSANVWERNQTAAVINCGNSGSIIADVFVHSEEIPVEIGGIAGAAGCLDGKICCVVNCWNTGDIRVTTVDLPAMCNGIRGGYFGHGDNMANCWSSGTVTVTATYGYSISSKTCYFLEGTYFFEGIDYIDRSSTFTTEELSNGILTSKLNDYVSNHPGEGLLTWEQGSLGRPELKSSNGKDQIPAKGDIIKSGKDTYKVTKAGSTVAYMNTTNVASTIKIPATIKIDDVVYKVTSISAGAFQNNKYVKTVVIGNNVTTIGNNAFNGCTKLKNVTIGSKVKKIGKQAFKGCKNLATINIKSARLASVDKDAFKGIKSNAIIKVPSEMLSDYQKLLKGKGQGGKVVITE